MTECNFMCSLEQENPVWLQAESALNMLIIHSPDYVFTVLVGTLSERQPKCLVSIFISKIHNRF